MIYGLGIDLIDFAQINIQNDALIKKVLTDKEYTTLSKITLEKNRLAYFAGRFAAKEAFVKALGTGFRDLLFSDIQVMNDELGKPNIEYVGTLAMPQLADCQIQISISHSQSAATAIVIIEK